MYFNKKIILAGIAAVTVGLQGCASNNQPMENGLSARLSELESQISAKDMRIQQLESASTTATASTSMDTLLPPDAKAGECYARVWVPPTYRTKTEDKLVSEASERVEVIPAKYEWAEETVLVSEASSRLEQIPAVYGTEKETIKVSDASRVWRIAPGKDAAPASPELLAAAKAGNIDLESATPGMCFHEHYRPASYKTVENNVLVSEASESISINDPQYRWVEKEVLVSEASYKLVEVPAVYGWEEEQIIDKPANTIWKKGVGPIQRIDEATGEIMCLVEIPATYKTIRKRVLKSPATTTKVEIPAVYKTVKVRELAEPAVETKNEIPAEYKIVTGQEKVADATFVWHEIHNREEPRTTRTGQQICLTEIPAKYKTVTRRVVKTPATVKTIEIPAEYKTVKVKKLVSASEEKRIPIAAEYKTVSFTELDKEGYMEWRSILCKTNMTGARITQIQTALKEAGYDPGPIDGVIGMRTIAAINAFQRDNNLPVDKYINIDTLKALGVSAS